MKVCIIGNGLISLTLAQALVNRGVSVDILCRNKPKNYDLTRTLGISDSNIKYINKYIINIEKIQWKIKKIKVYTENFTKDEVLNFSRGEKNLFSIIKNHQLYTKLNKNLKKDVLFNYKKNLSYKNIIKKNYKLIIVCDSTHEITKKFFFRNLKKDYNSQAYTTIINHKKILNNNIAIQVFTKKGPIAFLPISEDKTSVVCSLRTDNSKININNLIQKFNPKYQISKINKISFFELRSSNLRKYYKDNMLAFGDLLHRVHPLAGQGFNMTLRDIKELISIIDEKIKLGLEFDNSICVDFENKTKDKNFFFSESIDWIYELFNFESKFKKNLLGRPAELINKNKYLNNFIKKFADVGF